MTQKELFEIWGFLEDLRNRYDAAAKDVAKRGKDPSDYLRWISRIDELHAIIDREAETAPEDGFEFHPIKDDGGNVVGHIAGNTVTKDGYRISLEGMY